MSRRIELFALLLVALMGCAPPPTEADRPDGLASGPCVPFGASPSQPGSFDPILGSTPVPTPTPARPPLPTCTPWGGTPAPTPTPLSTLPAGRNEGPPGRVSSAPQNLTMSPWSEGVDRLALAANVKAVTWHGDGDMVSLFTELGNRSFRVADVLGAGSPAAVAVSPAGRIHLYAAGRYAYSDDRGVSWSAPVAAPYGDRLHVVVSAEGFARLFWLSGSALHTALQRLDGTWGADEFIASGVQDYDAVRVAAGVVVAASGGGGTRVLRFPGGQAASWSANGSAVNLVYRREELTLGLGGMGGKAVFGRSLDDGRSWSGLCTVQQSDHTIDSVAVFPTAQGPYAAIYAWRYRSFPIIVLAQVHWLPGQPCAPWPGVGEADRLTIPGFRNGPPGLFELRAPQVHFRVVSDEDVAFLAFQGWSDDENGDVYVADVYPDGIFSGPSLGSGQPFEGGP